jgi:lipopolysaccharide biosynthesis glycosyltransferase
VKIAAFTSLTTSYLPNGRILGKSVKEQHPEWDFILLFNDRTPDFVNWEEEPFDKVVFADWLDIGRPWYRWAYDYSVVEFCTAAKGPMSEYLLNDLGYDAIIYLDPDILVFSRLEEVLQILNDKRADVILTPHLTDREFDEEAVWSHEIAALKHGTFNLGFFAVANRPSGRAFVQWWRERLVDHSHIDFDQGLFTDQKWCNLAPYMFSDFHVLTDRRYNVATWNMRNREISFRGGVWYVNGSPLRFYHFSGFGNDFAWADRELAAFNSNPALRELWSLYKELYSANELAEPAPAWYWGCDRYGRRLTREMRAAARRSSSLNPYGVWWR